MKILGVIGGLDPKTGFEFCLRINDRVKDKIGVQPHIIVENIPVTKKAEKDIINGGASNEHLELIVDSIKRMEKDSDFIVIPCNTVHIFIDKFRNKSIKPIISIIEETAKKCKKLKVSRVGILASTKTIKNQLHNVELVREGIEVVLPNFDDQKIVSKLIIKIIDRTFNEDDFKTLIRIVSRLEKRCDAIVVGCTTLSDVFKGVEIEKQIIDTTKVLEDVIVEKFTKI